MREREREPWRNRLQESRKESHAEGDPQTACHGKTPQTIKHDTRKATPKAIAQNPRKNPGKNPGKNLRKNPRKNPGKSGSEKEKETDGNERKRLRVSAERHGPNPIRIQFQTESNSKPIPNRSVHKRKACRGKTRHIVNTSGCKVSPRLKVTFTDRRKNQRNPIIIKYSYVRIATATKMEFHRKKVNKREKAHDNEIKTN